MTTLRAQHWTDTQIAGRSRRRAVRNWSNYRQRDLSGALLADYAACSQAIEQGSAPIAWQGAYDFRYQVTRGPLQCFAGDSTDPSNTALVGVRRSDKPGAWINIKALGVQAVQPVTSADPLQIAWPLLWTQTDLAFRVHRHKLQKIIKRRDETAPLAFRFVLRVPDGYVLDVIEGEGGYLRVLDENGVCRLRSECVHGWDSSTVASTPTGALPIRMYLMRGNNVTIGGKIYPTVWVTFDADDCAGAVHPVFGDPTLRIEGTTDVEDTMLRASGPTANWGGYDQIIMREGATPEWRGLIRAKYSAIPGGMITGARLYMYRSTGGPANVRTYKALHPWVEGAQLGTAGVANFNEYDTSLAWDTAGCRNAGGDFDINYSDNQGINTTAWYTWTITNSWAEAWRMSGSDNGVMLGYYDSGLSSEVRVYSSEGTNPAYWEFDYTPASTGTPKYFTYGNFRTGQNVNQYFAGGGFSDACRVAGSLARAWLGVL